MSSSLTDTLPPRRHSGQTPTAGEGEKGEELEHTDESVFSFSLPPARSGEEVLEFESAHESQSDVDLLAPATQPGSGSHSSRHTIPRSPNRRSVRSRTKTRASSSSAHPGNNDVHRTYTSAEDLVHGANDADMLIAQRSITPVPRKSSASMHHVPLLRAPIYLDVIVQRATFREAFGFEITGGLEFGRPLTISDVYPESPAHLAGLQANDVVLAIEQVDASQLSHSDTVQIVKTALEVQFKIQRGGATDNLNRGATKTLADVIVDPNLSPSTSKGKLLTAAGNGRAIQQLNNQAYAWIDVHQQPCSPPPEEDAISIMQLPANILPERQSTLLVSDHLRLGLLVRGGLEYGLGIYVTGLDKASAAEAADLKIGDQLLTVNEHDFRRITHPKAVRILRSNRHMVLKIRHVGKLPYARRLNIPTTNSTRSVGATNNAHSTDHAFWSPPVPTMLDLAQEEILRLTREASQDPLVAMLESREDLIDGLISPDIPLLLDPEWPISRNGKKNIQSDRKSVHHNKSATGAKYWLSVVADNAEILLEEETQREALAYFLREYLTESICVDALVLALFHLINSLHKLQLLDDIRNLIVPQDIQRYDSLTSGMKTEIMTSPVTLFANLSPSTDQLNLHQSLSREAFLSPDDPFLLVPSSLNPAALTSVQSLSPRRSNAVSSVVPTVTTKFPIRSSLTVPGHNPVRDTSQQFAKVNSHSSSDLTSQEFERWSQFAPTPTPQPTLNHNPAPASRFEYDAPQIEVDLFTPLLPQPTPQPIIVDPVMFHDQVHIPTAAGELIRPMSQQMYLQNGNKNYSGDYAPMEEGRHYFTAQGLHGAPGHHLTRHSFSNDPAFDGGVHHGSYPPTSHSANFITPPRRHTYQGKGPQHPQLPENARLQSSPKMERHYSASGQYYPGSPHHISSFSPVRSRTQFSHGSLSDYGDDHERGGSAGSSRRTSMNEEASIIEHEQPPPPPVRPRPQSLQVPDTKIGPAKGDAKTPVIIETVLLQKNAAYLGIAIEGGIDTKQVLPRIINIQPKGCAHLNGNLKVGHVILSVNGKKLDGVTHAQAVNIITEIFLDKSTQTMEFIVKEVNKLPAT